MTNNDVVTSKNPVIKFVIRESYSGLVAVVAKYKIPTESPETFKMKVISKIHLTDVKNSAFFEVGEKGSLILSKPEFAKSVEKICKELGIVIEMLVIRTMCEESSFAHKMIFTESLNGIDRESPEWKSTFTKQVEMVVKLLDGTVVE